MTKKPKVHLAPTITCTGVVLRTGCGVDAVGCTKLATTTDLRAVTCSNCARLGEGFKFLAGYHYEKRGWETSEKGRK